MEKRINLKLPMLPNYLFSEDKNIQYDIKELTDVELKEIGKEWTEALLVSAKKRRDRLK